MKLLVLLSSLFLYPSLGVWAIEQGAGKFSEELYVFDPGVLSIVKDHPELIVDHISAGGFELYGPHGTSEWLEFNNIKFKNMKKHLQKQGDFLGYPSFEKIEKFLKDIVKKNPSIAKLISLGKSVEGRDLWAVKISDNVQIDEVEPEFKYISSMHGDEITGRELSQFLIKDLIEGYQVDAEITQLIDNTEIYIIPSMNPDGSRKKQRANANGFDLNRNFPDWSRGDVNNEDSRQAETKAFMRFQKERNFSLSANFHGGAVVVNYPWDNTYDRHPFDELIQKISLKYAFLNPAMRNSRSFEGGITNGADWYVLKGGMQDWSYFWYNDLQVTVELSSKKWPRYSAIPSFYKDNKASMLAYIGAIHQGAGFRITGASINSGKVQISQKTSKTQLLDKGSYGFSGSEFYKVLPIGEYQFDIELDGGAKWSLNLFVDEEIGDNGNFHLLEL